MVALTPVVIADRRAAAGWRLAGARVRVPAPGEAAAVLAESLAEAELVIVEAACARELPASLAATARRSLRPLVLLLEDEPGAAAGRAARRALGVLP